MKLALAVSAALLSTSVAAQPGASLPGVANEETEIPSGNIREYHRGHGDVIFVRHETDRWYRVRLNDGCLSNLMRSDRLVFDQATSSGRIDRYTRVRQPAIGASCSIRSIRRSEAPPQVNSKSPVTLD